jgi:hypothetical protein
MKIDANSGIIVDVEYLGMGHQIEYCLLKCKNENFLFNPSNLIRFDAVNQLRAMQHSAESIFFVR